MLPNTKPTTDFFARTMRTSDVELVAQNEAASYEHPWTKRIVIDCLRAGYQCWVLANKQQIVAHGVMSVAIGECHLLTLCVRPEYQRHGYGKKLFKLLLDRAHKQDAEICYLEVRQSNAGAIELYRSMGFRQIGERKNYYPGKDSREDALIMSRDLPLP
ncbi:MAG: ribosomal-protein-alanine acetyltransferase [Pseudohongiella sp.]|nr:MAG: ribosomal-protein-alanine acetyltransferase [Pseudohongiella sp.]